MSTFAIVPGAWDTPLTIELVIEPLDSVGHDVIVVDLPCREGRRDPGGVRGRRAGRASRRPGAGRAGRLLVWGLHHLQDRRRPP